MLYYTSILLLALGGLPFAYFLYYILLGMFENENVKAVRLMYKDMRIIAAERIELPFSFRRRMYRRLACSGALVSAGILSMLLSYTLE